MKQNYFIIFFILINYSLFAQTNIAPTASVSISSSFQTGNYTASDLIDGDTTASDWSTGWYANFFNSGSPQYAEFDFGDGNLRMIDEYHLYGHSDASVRPPSHRFEARNLTTDTWTILNTVTTRIASGKNEYTFMNNTGYRYFRVLMIDNGGASGTAGFQEIELFGTPVLSVNNPKSVKQISIYPNPTTDYISISNLENSYNYLIVSQLGQEVLNGTYNNKIDVRNLTNGIYFLKIEGRNTLKFIKK